MFHIEPTVTQELTDREIKILDANYKAAGLPKIVENNFEHLSNTNKPKLLELLSDGTLGD